jgi:hypothetical protein
VFGNYTLIAYLVFLRSAGIPAQELPVSGQIRYLRVKNPTALWLWMLHRLNNIGAVYFPTMNAS